MASLDFEQRRSPRVSLFHEVICEGGHATARSEAADLSVGGMFIDLVSPPFLPLELITVRFAVGPEFRPVVVEADVNYVQDGIGIGIRFLNLAPEDRERIADYVERTIHRPVLRGEFHLRKSARVSVTVPVVLRARNADGTDVEEPAQIITLSKHGACLLTRQPMTKGRKVLLATPSGREFTSSIVWVGDGPSRSDGQVGIQCRGLAQSLGFRFP
jgi:hypothetical protein